VSAREPIDRFAGAQGAERRLAVRLGAKAGHEKRTDALFRDYDDPTRLRTLAGRIKQHTLDHLDRYLERAEARLTENGARVHFASDADSACRTVLGILEKRGVKAVVKAKTMVSEEIRLSEFLERHGIASLETDLGEFVVQLGRDHPSHIVKPILHKNRREVAEIFEREGLGAYDDAPEVITRRARAFLRKKYLEADAGITGANFVSAESGRVVIVTNEGNSRFCLAATRCHIALVGIEKLVPTDRDLSVFLNLLARSGTGQELTVYTEFLSGPRRETQPDGPDEMHVVFLDNGRTAALASDCHEVLRCIRCGACLNVCPVYRQASGHAYRSVYPGPVGAVLTPLLAQQRFGDFADLPRASSLCGACHEVCPVDIPLEELLLKLRSRAKASGYSSAAAPPWGAWALVATEPMLWRAALASGKLLESLPDVLKPPALRGFEARHELPEWRGGAFRRWLVERERRAQILEKMRSRETDETDEAP
jgi:L-lactate dehydrogenase complex protein LldF